MNYVTWKVSSSHNLFFFLFFFCSFTALALGFMSIFSHNFFILFCCDEAREKKYPKGTSRIIKMKSGTKPYWGEHQAGIHFNPEWCWLHSVLVPDFISIIWSVPFGINVMKTFFSSFFTRVAITIYTFLPT